MSRVAYAKAVIGFVISENELFEDTINKVATCPKGHQQLEGNAPYCDQDGGPFVQVGRLRSVPRLV